MMSASPVARRWPRLEVNLPVRAGFLEVASGPLVEGRALQMSERGMSLCAGIPFNLNDRVQIEFAISSNARITGIVRNRNGFCFGVEFLSPLPVDALMDTAVEDGDLTSSPMAAGNNHNVQSTFERAFASFRDLHQSFIREKENNNARLRKEVDALRTISTVLQRATESRDDVDPRVLGIICHVTRLLGRSVK